MPDIIQLGLADAMREAAKRNSDMVAALPHDEASVVANAEGVTAIVGADVGSHVTAGGWVTRTWNRTVEWGAAVKVKWGK